MADDLPNILLIQADRNRSAKLSIAHISTLRCGPVAISWVEGIGRDSVSGTESA